MDAARGESRAAFFAGDIRRCGMRNKDRFFEAFGHMEHVVMGRRLAKFTLRHRFWLEAMESPVVTGGKVGLMDLELATRVCAMRFEDLDVGLPRMLSRGPRWWERLGYLGRAWRRSAETEYRLLLGYLLDYGCPPETYDAPVQVVGADGCEVQETGPLPGLLNLVTGLVRGSNGWTPETVWGLAPGEAEWYLAGIFVHRGADVGLVSAADEAVMEMLEERKRRAGSVEQGEELKRQGAKDAKETQREEEGGDG